MGDRQERRAHRVGKAAQPADGERGVRPEQGLQMVVRDGSGGLAEALAFVYGSTVLEQRCLFHKLRNVADKARSELKGEEKREDRQQLLEQASAIYRAERAAQTRERLTRWADDWRERAPQAVATLERDFEQTLVYYSLESVAQEWIRTTALEDANQSALATQVSPGRHLWQSQGG
jgi:transposase-like protein